MSYEKFSEALIEVTCLTDSVMYQFVGATTVCRLSQDPLVRLMEEEALAYSSAIHKFRLIDGV